MCRGDGFADVLDAGSVSTGTVAQPRRAPGLVQRDPTFDRVAEGSRHEVHVLTESLGGVAYAPATFIFDRLRKVPVIERQRRLNVARQQSVDESTVEVQSGLIGGTLAVGLHPGPSDREPVRADTERLHEVEVFVHSVIVVTGDVAGVAVPDLSGLFAKGVPDGWAAPVGVDGAFDLVRGCGGSPEETRWERARWALVVGARRTHVGMSPDSNLASFSEG